MQKTIFHLHDVCCKHSTLTLEDAVNYSIKHGYKALYWTEHCPVSVSCGYAHRRPTHEELTNLKNRMEEYNNKYGPNFHIYFGYEVEYNKPNRWYYEKLARDPLCDFLILGVHFYGDLFKEPWPYPYCINDTHTPKDIKEYLEMSKTGMESGLFSWAPHPEIWLNSYAKWDKYAIAASKKIIHTAIKTRTPLGFNVNFKSLNEKSEWHYPSKYFWNLVTKTSARVIIESDAHCLEKITEPWLKQAHEMAINYGLSHNIVETIPMRWLPKKPLLVLYENGLDKYISKSLRLSLEKNKVKLVEINSKTNLKNVCKQNNIHPVWTLGLIKNTSLLRQAKKTSMFIISDLKTRDLSLNDFSNMDYDSFLKEFIKEI